MAEDGIGAEVGLEPGDRLLAINGHPLRDVIDYRFYGAEEQLLLDVERAGEVYHIEVERDEDERLGLDFAEPVFDGLRLCRNRCPFCFVQQLPRGLRRSLYLRDDDYRFSFLFGNYITLTNLSEPDWQRIGEQALSPLYVSIHASDDAVRRTLLGQPEAPEILPQLQRLGEMGVRVHGQIVIVPGANDDTVLRRTVDDVAGLWPTVQTLAIVPVGLTSLHCEGVRLLRPAEAACIVEWTLAQAAALRGRLGTTWLYPSDELFLLAGRPVPEARFYEDPAQLENGVGLVGALLDDWARAKRRAVHADLTGRRATLVCGTLIAPVLADLLAELQALTGLDAQLVPVENRLLGPSVTVSGLLAGADVVAALDGRDLGERVFLPGAMFDAEGRLTLDDEPPEGLARHLGVPVSLVWMLGEVLDRLTGRRSRRR